VHQPKNGLDSNRFGRHSADGGELARQGKNQGAVRFQVAVAQHPRGWSSTRSHAPPQERMLDASAKPTLLTMSSWPNPDKMPCSPAPSMSADGHIVASPEQVAVDLLTGPGRNPAEGEELLSWILLKELVWRSRG
jgi:hypothetical protein